MVGGEAAGAGIDGGTFGGDVVLDTVFGLVRAESQRRQLGAFVEKLRVGVVDEVYAIAVSRKDLAGDSRVVVEV